MVDGKEEPNEGTSIEECRYCYNELPPPKNLEANCLRRHREEGKFVSFDDYQHWLSVIHAPGTQNERYLRFGQSFCNHFNVHDTGLFYETNAIVASHCIWTNYIEGDYYTPQYDEDGRIL